MEMTNTRRLAELKKKLAAAGVADPAFEAREILREYAGDARLTAEAVKRRLTGEPLQYIFGRWEFYGYPFLVGKGVLIPRPETELLVDIAAEMLSADSTVLDLFSGTGCIPLSITLKTGAKCYAVELHDAAFSYLGKNIALNKANVTALQADACDGTLFPGLTFDAVFANPPYITDEEMKTLMREVRFEPETALCGGEDGLYFYKRFIPAWAGRIKDGGFMACEIGETQGEAVSAVMQASGLQTRIIKDYAGLDRVVMGTK